MIALRATPIDTAEVASEVGGAEHGGAVVFVGSTREETSGRPVAALAYEAYEELALAEMEAICAEAARRHGARIALVHRLGRVPVGETAVVVAASAAGRTGAFAATKYVIDELKRRVPIWKRAEYADGGAEWLPGA